MNIEIKNDNAVITMTQEQAYQIALTLSYLAMDNKQIPKHIKTPIDELIQLINVSYGVDKLHDLQMKEILRIELRDIE